MPGLFDDLPERQPAPGDPPLKGAFDDLPTAMELGQAATTGAFDDLPTAKEAAQQRLAAADPNAPTMSAAPERTLWGELGEAFQTLIGNRDGSLPRPPIERIFDAGGRVADAITPDALQRGLRRGEQGMALALDMTGIGPENALGPEADQSRLAVDLANLQREAERFPMPAERAAALKGISDAGSVGELVDTVMANPGQAAAATGDVVLESIGVGAPGLALTAVGSAAGPGGTAVAAGASGLATEYTQTILQKIQERGGDPSDPMTWSQALNDPAFMADAKRSGLERGIPIATFDALTAGLAGRFISAASGVPQVMLAAGKEAGMQAGGGAIGETAAQLTDEGEISSVGEIALEGVAELPGGVVEAGGNVVHERSRQRAEAARLEEQARAEAVRQLDPNKTLLVPSTGQVTTPAPSSLNINAVTSQSSEGEPPEGVDHVQQLTPGQSVQPAGGAAVAAPGGAQPGAAQGGEVAAGAGPAGAAAPVVGAAPVDPPDRAAAPAPVTPTAAPAAAAPPAPAAPPQAAPAAGATSPTPPPAVAPGPETGQASGAAAAGSARQTVTTASGRKVDTEFQVVDLSELKQASGDLQNRDRTRATSDLQIQNIAGNLDPERLGDSAEADRGAPIVGDDGVIESGNGRVAAIRKAYESIPERAEAYRQFLSKRGYAIDGINQPVLIRRRKTAMTPEERRAFVIESNTSATARLNAVEQAKSDADLVGDDVLQLYRGGELGTAGNRDFVRALVGKLPPSEQPSLYGPDGTLSQEGIRRVQNAVLARAYGDAGLLSKLTEDQDNNIRSIGGALLDVAGAWAQLAADVKAGRVKPGFDITERLVDAARRVSVARDRGETVQQVLGQIDAFNPMDPVTERLIRAFYDPSLSRAAGRDKIADFLRSYADQASKQTTDATLFGDADVTPEAVLDTLLGKRQKEAPAQQGALFGGGKAAAKPMEDSTASARDQTQTLEFKRWFGDSKITEDWEGRGEPRRLYHATAGDFDTFRLGSENPSPFGNESGRAIFLTDSATDQRAGHNIGRGGNFRDGVNVMPVYARIENPLFVDDLNIDKVVRDLGLDKGFPYLFSQANVDKIKAAGHDGVVLFSMKDDVPTEIAVFDPAQIKSATANRGVFNKNSPNIMEDRLDDRRDAEDDAEGARGDAEDEADLLAELDDEPQQSQRGRGATPEIMRVSFTNRRSWQEQAFIDAGVDPAEATLWPIERQYQVLAKLVHDKFGITVKKSEKLPGRFAVDQLLDLTRNLQFMANMLGMPNHAMGLRDTLTLVFRKDMHYFGAMYPQAATVEGVSFPAGAVVLPRRSNSFAHEWMHALDLFLMREFEGKDFALLSQQIKLRGVDFEPGSSMEAFVNVMNHLFFDDASRAQKILALQLKLSDPNTPPSTAKKLEAQLETLRRGNARPKNVKPSEYAANAAGFEPGRADYWANPQEMLARAFEAYTAFKVEAAGGTTEAIAKGELAYLSDADRRLAMTFPKGDERMRIFRAFERLFDAMAKEQLIADGVAAGVPGNTQIFDPRVWDRTPARKAEYAGIAGAVKQTIDEIKTDHAHRQRQKERPQNPKTVKQRIQDVLRATYAQRSVFRMLERRYPQSKTLRQLADLLVNAPGQDRVVGRTYEEAVEQRVKQGFNRLGNIVERYDLQKLDSAGLRILRDLLISENVQNAPANIRAGAVELRKFLDTEWYRNHQAGLEIGYTKNGYLPRMLDMARVMTDRKGFIAKAAKVYEVIFDTEFGADATDVLSRDGGLRAFLKQAKQAGGLDAEIKMIVKLARRISQLHSKAKALKAKGEDADQTLAKAAELEQELVEAVDAIYGPTRTAYGLRRAAHWHATLMTTAIQDFDAMSPDSKYTKSRKLPPQADKLLEDFYINDPLDAIQHYLLQSARRTEYATRFGAKSEKLEKFFEQMAAEGVSPEDQNYIGIIVSGLTGRSKSNISPAVAGFLNFLHAIGTMMMLPRAVQSSLGEPTAAAIRSGDLTDTFKPYLNLVKQVVGTADAKDWKEISRVIGAVSNSFADTLAANRFGGTFDSTVKTDIMLSRFFKRTMLSGLTNAQRGAVLPLAHEFLLNLSARIKSGRDVANSRALLAELGIRDVEAFADWLLQEQGIPTVEDLYDSNGVETKHGAEWATAVNRYLDQVIQNPKGYDRPAYANTPAGRLIYGILSFSMSFYANVWKRQAALVKGIAERKGVAPAAAYAALQLAPSLIALYLVQTMVSTIREAIFNPDRWEEWEREGVLQERMLQLGLTRAFSFGLTDPFIQAFTGLKYQRDLSNVMVGAVPGLLLQSIQGLLTPFVNNSDKTNNAEYKAAQSAFQLAATPAVVYGLSMIPGGRLVDPVYGMAMMYLTAPAMRDNFADLAVGEKDSRVAARERAERRENEGGRQTGRGDGGRETGRETGR